MTSSEGTVILTGANGGLASAFVFEFLKSPHSASCYGIYTVRDPSTAHSLHAALSHASQSHSYEVSTLDLSTLENVRQFAAGINKRVTDGSLPPIRALILHGSVQVHGPPTFTPDGIESTLAVNYLSNFLLVLLLLKSVDREHGRILHISSNSHAPEWNSWAYKSGQPRFFYTDFDKLMKGEESWGEETPWLAGFKRYAMSKTLMMMFSYSLQKRLTASPTLSNISVLALDPALVGGTSIARSASLPIRIFMALAGYVSIVAVWFWPNGLFRTAAKTGRDTIFACFDTETLGQSPRALYLDGTRVKRSGEETYDEKKWAKLWEKSLQAVGVGEGDTVLEDWR